MKNPIPCEIERDAPLTLFEKLAGIVAVLSFTLGAFAVTALLSGCASTPSGVKVVASSATYTNVGDINWDEYKIPVFSVFTGPRVTVWVNKDYLNIVHAECEGSVTNNTTCLGIYATDEQKQTSVSLDFSPAVTNVPQNVREI